MKLSRIDWVAVALVIIGALSWGMLGAFDYNLVGSLLGDMTIWARIVYVFVGLSGLYIIWLIMKIRRPEPEPRSEPKP